MIDKRAQAINSCVQCHLVCRDALTYYTDESGGVQLTSQQVKRLMACIEICQTTANLLAIRAPLIGQICEICALICQQCAMSCRSINTHMMKDCSLKCMECAKVCFEESDHIKQAA